MTTSAISAPGKCKLIGCPGWGRHPAHSPSVKIGAGNWDDYSVPMHCLGYPKVTAGHELLHIACSLDGLWNAAPRPALSPTDMALLVDVHKRECPNRSPRG